MVVAQQGGARVVHVCTMCAAVMAVHYHASYEEIMVCLTRLKVLCDDCLRAMVCGWSIGEVKEKQGNEN